MNILIISRTPWNSCNSFGNTFTNLFGGMENVNIYNICCKSGNCDNGVTSKVLQFTDVSVLKSIIKKSDAGLLISEKNKKTVDSQQKQSKVYSKIVAKRSTVALLARDAIWKFGRWKKSKLLDDFLQETKPDIIYLPIYASWYMCDVEEYIIQKTGVPVVGHITDDVYGYPKGYLCSPLFMLYRAVLRRKIRRLISRCEYIEVFAENMKTEYERLFNKTCYVIGKGVDLSEKSDTVTFEQKKPIRLVYTGNIGTGRYKTLCDIACILDRFIDKSSAVLDVYTATPLSDTMKRRLGRYNSLRLMPAVDSGAVRKIQKNADWLVHVECFDKKAIFETSMSFSTKIIDYMQARRPILAVGPECVNSISFLRNNELALTACSYKELETVTCNILNSCYNIEELVSNVDKYIRNNRDIKMIQRGIFERLDNVVKNINTV